VHKLKDHCQLSPASYRSIDVTVLRQLCDPAAVRPYV